jgi:hypothetical protein
MIRTKWLRNSVRVYIGFINIRKATRRDSYEQGTERLERNYTGNSLIAPKAELYFVELVQVLTKFQREDSEGARLYFRPSVKQKQDVSKVISPVIHRETIENNVGNEVL